MFYYLKGIVAAIEQNLAVVDVNGIGFSCNTSMRSLSALEIGKEIQLFTWCNIREDAFDIYGFVSKKELECFKLLVAISGVGPKAALSILSAASPEELALAVANGNEKALTIAPGVGKKLAQRILLELKDKLAGELNAVTPGSITMPAAIGGDGKVRDVSAALAVLGYTPTEINAALSKLDLEPLSVEDAIKAVLKTALR